MKTKDTYAVYASVGDMTFIVQDTYKNGELLSTEVIGFHYGEPDANSVDWYSGKRKARYKW